MKDMPGFGNSQAAHTGKSEDEHCSAHRTSSSNKMNGIAQYEQCQTKCCKDKPIDPQFYL